MNYLQKKLKDINEVSQKDAKKYFLGSGYFPDGSILPVSVNPDGLKKVTLDKIDWTKPQAVARTSSIDIITDKDNKGLRRFSLMHPYAYLHIANEIIENFDEFKKRLLRETPVSSYAIPHFDGKDQIKLDWMHFSSTDPSKYFLEYGYVVSTDIYNFYESIYTHSISWAMHGKQVAKDNVRDFTLLGNKLDKLFQNAHDGQTNGIPTGNVLSDLVSELILKDMDELIGGMIDKLGVKAFRYRDDFRFVCKDRRDARKMLDGLALMLNNEYGLTLNQSKTKIESCEEYRYRISVPELGVKLPFKPHAGEIHIDWRSIHQYIEKCKKAGTNTKNVFDKQMESLMISLRSVLTKQIIAEESDDWAGQIYSSLIDCINSGVSNSGYTFLLMDFMLSNVKDKTLSKELLDSLILHFKDSHNERSKMWAYAILLHISTEKAKVFAQSQSSPLFRMLLNSSTPQIDQFSTRDRIPTKDREKLKNITVVGTSLIKSIETISPIDYIFGSIPDKDFEAISSSHYDD